MNNFTKEELIKIKNGLEYLPDSVNMSSQYWDECKVIISKIQSMIDAYCDHTNLDTNICYKCGYGVIR